MWSITFCGGFSWSAGFRTQGGVSASARSVGVSSVYPGERDDEDWSCWLEVDSSSGAESPEDDSAQPCIRNVERTMARQMLPPPSAQAERCELDRIGRILDASVGVYPHANADRIRRVTTTLTDAMCLTPPTKEWDVEYGRRLQHRPYPLQASHERTHGALTVPSSYVCGRKATQIYCITAGGVRASCEDTCCVKRRQTSRWNTRTVLAAATREMIFSRPFNSFPPVDWSRIWSA